MGKVHIPSEMELESWPVPPARGQHQQWWWVFICKKYQMLEGKINSGHQLELVCSHIFAIYAPNIFWILNVGKCSPGQSRPRQLSRLDQATIVEGKRSRRTDMYDKIKWEDEDSLVWSICLSLTWYISTLVIKGFLGWYITITFCPFRLPRTVWTMEPM